MSKAIADKVDLGAILRKVTPEDLQLISMLIKQTGFTPTHSIDIYKNRRGSFNRVRLWIILNLGTMRMTELYVTDEYGGLQDIEVILTVDSSAIVDNIKPIINFQKEVPELLNPTKIKPKISL